MTSSTPAFPRRPAVSASDKAVVATRSDGAGRGRAPGMPNSGPADAEAAARVTLTGEATCVAVAQNGVVGAIRILRLERRSAMPSGTRTAN